MAANVGIPLPSYKDYETGKKMPGGDAIASFMSIGINANWLLTGRGAMLIKDVSTGCIETVDSVYVPIPRRNGVDSVSEIVSLGLSRQWLMQVGTNPADLIYTHMQDDSMSPTIRENSLVVIDSSADKLSGDAIYALMLDGNIVVKRIQLDFSGGVLICGDNATYKSQHLTKDSSARLNVLGKVIWTGGAI